mgnify:CR=1 FL=1
MMMAFNVDMLEELGTANVDLSGRLSIRTTADDDDVTALTLNNLTHRDENGNLDRVVTTSLLGNENAPVVSEIKSFSLISFFSYKEEYNLLIFLSKFLWPR